MDTTIIAQARANIEQDKQTRAVEITRRLIEEIRMAETQLNRLRDYYAQVMDMNADQIVEAYNHGVICPGIGIVKHLGKGYTMRHDGAVLFNGMETEI